jgi:hypothetical protein
LDVTNAEAPVSTASRVVEVVEEKLGRTVDGVEAA